MWRGKCAHLKKKKKSIDHKKIHWQNKQQEARPISLLCWKSFKCRQARTKWIEDEARKSNCWVQSIWLIYACFYRGSNFNSLMVCIACAFFIVRVLIKDLLPRSERLKLKRKKKFKILAQHSKNYTREWIITKHYSDHKT